MLTLRKRQFVEQYKVLKNATEAAKSVGYKGNSVAKSASRLLKDVEISRIIKEWEAEELKKCYPGDKQSYVVATFERSKLVNHPPTAAKYWEIAGRVLGFLGDGESKIDNSRTIQVLISELKLVLPGGEIPVVLSSMNTTPCSPKSSAIESQIIESISQTSTSPQSNADHAIPTNSLNIKPDAPDPSPSESVDITLAQSATQFDLSSNRNSEAPAGDRHAPQGELIVNVNPLPNPLTTLKSTVESTNTPVDEAVTDVPVDVNAQAKSSLDLPAMDWGGFYKGRDGRSIMSPERKERLRKLAELGRAARQAKIKARREAQLPLNGGSI